MGRDKPRHHDKIPLSEIPAAEKRVPEYGASVTKQPMAAVNLPDGRKLRFRFDILDESNWTLHSITKAHHIRLIKRLKFFERMTVQEAKDNGSLGEYDMKDCKNKNATNVLKNAHNGRDNLTKLVIEKGGSLRMFGLREGNEIHLLWWDPRHEIWPEGKNVR